ncbi:serine acetyltransferase [Blastopirellula marina]|uniref:Serine acetyltransferase n=1 Tax=Blastopirellula marina TaxID=124 RepID=A0A2S8GNQ0_9BACT|nr:serine acetyltransferase [Blastopirellula marina]
MATFVEELTPIRAKAADEISSVVSDWERERPRQFWAPSRRLLRSIRKYQSWRDYKGPWRLLGPVFRRRWVISHRFWSVVCGADIPINSQIDGGLLLPHPVGVVVHPSAQIGPNCLLNANVVLGVGGKLPGHPILEGHVDIGAGACILGGVRLGEHSVVGANAVVLGDVPPFSTAVGAPARIIPRRPSAP